MGYVQYGAAAEKIAVSRKMIWPQPKGWTSEQSAAFPVNFLYRVSGVLEGGPDLRRYRAGLWGR